MRRLKSFTSIITLVCFGLLMLTQQVAAQESVTYYHNDLLGSPVAATDKSGAVLWRRHYAPFGVEVASEGEGAAKERKGYTGHVMDKDTGLVYMGARYYSPELGVFYGYDPAPVDPAKPFSFSRYSYAKQNPYRYVDPSGETPLDIGFLLFDVGKLGVAVYTGVGVGAAIADVGMSVVGVVSPIPGTGQAFKLSKIASAVQKANTSAKIVANSAPKYARNKYKSLTPKTKKGVLQKDPTCVYCKKKPSDTVDHVRSQKQDFVEGGFKDTRDVRSARVNDSSNLSGACRSCNSSKGSKDLKNWNPPGG